MKFSKLFLFKFLCLLSMQIMPASFDKDPHYDPCALLGLNFESLDKMSFDMARKEILDAARIALEQKDTGERMLIDVSVVILLRWKLSTDAEALARTVKEKVADFQKLSSVEKKLELQDMKGTLEQRQQWAMRATNPITIKILEGAIKTNKAISDEYEKILKDQKLEDLLSPEEILNLTFDELKNLPLVVAQGKIEDASMAAYQKSQSKIHRNHIEGAKYFFEYWVWSRERGFSQEFDKFLQQLSIFELETQLDLEKMRLKTIEGMYKNMKNKAAFDTTISFIKETLSKIKARINSLAAVQALELATLLRS